MTSYINIKNKADQHRKQKSYKEASGYYHELWDNYSSQCTKWDLWGLIFCENKLGNYDAALKMSRLGYQKYPDFRQIRQVYSWAIYYLVVKDGQEKKSFDKAVYGILKLTDYMDQYGPGVLTIFKAAARWNEEKEWQKTIDLLSKVDVSFLSQDSFSYVDNQGLSKELASPKEKYFAALTKAQIGAKAWQDCIQTAQMGLKILQKFHFGNNIWFRWRMSESHYHLGQYDLAVALLMEIRKKKKDWFFTAAIGTNKVAQKKYKEAKLFFAQACLEQGDWTKKTKVFTSLAQLFEQENNEQSLKNHLELLWNIYQKEGWKMGTYLSQQVERYAIKAKSLSQVKEEAMKIWTQIIEDNDPSLKGVITNVLPNQKVCFVLSKGCSYFGSINDFKGDRVFFRKGQEVLFRIAEGYDRKKKRKTQNAVQIRPQKGSK